MKYYQQGDVILIPIKEIPKDVTEIHPDNAIQYGEITGHRHAFTGKPLIQFRKTDFDDSGNFTKYVTIKETEMLSHEEHKTIEIPSGLYESRIVREFDHFSGIIRKVRD